MSLGDRAPLGEQFTDIGPDPAVSDVVAAVTRFADGAIRKTVASEPRDQMAPKPAAIDETPECRRLSGPLTQTRPRGPNRGQASSLAQRSDTQAAQSGRTGPGPPVSVTAARRMDRRLLWGEGVTSAIPR